MRYDTPRRNRRRAPHVSPRDTRRQADGITAATQWSVSPGTASGNFVSQNPEDPPVGWTLDVEDTFSGSSLDTSIWKSTGYTGGAHCASQGCSAQWDAGAGISVSGGNMRLRVQRNGASWLVTGLTQGSGNQFSFEEGYGEFHVRFRARFTAAHAPGIGFYGLMWPWHNVWSSELDIVETPGQDKTRSTGTVHWDTELNNFQVGNEFSGPDLSQFCTWDCRRTYTFLNGRKVARIQWWLNGVKLLDSDGTTIDEAEQNLFAVEPMVLGFATYVRCPVDCVAWFSDIDSTTPDLAFLEVDFVRIWRPEPAVASALVPSLDVLIRGADAAAALITAGGITEIQRIVRALTGIATVNVIGGNAGVGRTTFTGTSTFAVTGGSNAWITGDPVTTPTLWTSGAALTGTATTVSTSVSTNPAVPLLDVPIHWEADLQATGAAVAAYATARTEVNRRVVAGVSKAAGKLVVFDGFSPTSATLQAPAIAAVNDAWAAGVYLAGSAEKLAVGNVLDCTAAAGTWNAAGALQAAQRIAVRLARYCHDKGWTANDLGGLPGAGPQIGGIRRESDTALQVFVQHDRGSDIVIPATVNPAAFQVTDGTTTVTGTAVNYRTTQSFIVTFSGNVPTTPGTVLRHCWTPGFFGAGTLVSDNFHTSGVYKPGVIGSTSGVGTLVMPLQRTIVAVPVVDGSQAGQPPSTTIRGRPRIVNNTLVTEQGTPFRGLTMALDGPGTDGTNYATNRANWQKFRDLKFNVVRLDAPLSEARGGTQTVASQIAYVDQCIDHAEATGMYVQLMCGGPYGNANYSEQNAFWSVAAARYANRTCVFYEPNNEPHYGSDFSAGDLDNITTIYNLIHNAAPQTLVGLLCPAAVTDAPGLVSLCNGLVQRGVTFGPAWVAFHGYDSVSDSAYQTLKNAYPCMMTEYVSTSRNQSPNEIDKVQQMERLGISWELLHVRFGELTNTDTPWSADENSLTSRIIPGLTSAGITWAQDSLGTSQPPTTTRNPVFSSNIASAALGSPTTITVTGLIPNENYEWTVVQSNASFTWRLDPPIAATADSSGTGTFNATFIATNDFIKLLFDSRTSSIDSAKVQTVPAQPQPGGDAAFAQSWHDSLRFGVNFERFRPQSFDYQGNAYRNSAAGWNYFLSQGVTHVRFFYGWDASIDFAGDGITMDSGRRPTIDKLNAFIDPIQQAARAGLKVWVDFTDVANIDSVRAHYQNVKDHHTDFCNLLAARPELTPDKLMVGSFNELVEWQGVGTNTDWNATRMELHALIRGILPNHIIAHGAANWCSYDRLCASDWQAPPDKRAMGSFHHYYWSSYGRSFWTPIQAALDDFSVRNGIPHIAGEGGDGAEATRNPNSPGAIDAWVTMFTDISVAAPRTKHTWWAVTNAGNNWALLTADNQGFHPKIETVFRNTRDNWA
jgi:hypothetical protein